MDPLILVLGRQWSGALHLLFITEYDPFALPILSSRMAGTHPSPVVLVAAGTEPPTCDSERSVAESKDLVAKDNYSPYSPTIPRCSPKTPRNTSQTSQGPVKESVGDQFLALTGRH